MNKVAKKLEVIEALRFFAALSVVFVHIPIIAVGDFGVDAFFVISGFVMMLSTQINYDNFFLKRLIRICPTYYFFTIGVFLLAILFPDLFNALPIKEFSLLPAWTSALLSSLISSDCNAFSKY